MGVRKRMGSLEMVRGLWDVKGGFGVPGSEMGSSIAGPLFS